MKKGFTLVELLAVIIIIAIIGTVSVLSINYSIKRAQERLYLEQVERLEESLSNWALNNIGSLPIDENGISFFDIERLTSEGIINSDEVIDPRTNERMDGCVVITFNEVYNQYTFKYSENSCEDTADSYMPIITVVGGSEQTVEVNEVYVMPKVSAVDYLGNSLKVVGPVLTNQSGDILRRINTGILSQKSNSHDYIITYRAIDEKLNLEVKKDVYLKVDDTIRPVIEVLGSTRSSSIVLEANPTLSIPSATVRDNSCGVDGDDVSVNSCDDTFNYQVQTNIASPRVPGNYSVTYVSDDYYNNRRTLVLNVEIEDTLPPTVPTFDLRLNSVTGSVYNGSWTNQNVWLGNLDSNDLGVGVEKYEYTFNCSNPSGTWVEVTDSVTFSSTTNAEICVRAVDYVGNASDMSAPRQIRVDKTAPTCNVTGGSTTWFNTNRTITGTCSDSDSGCATPTTVSRTFTSDINSLESPGQVCDVAGNCTPCNTTRVRIDKTDPSISHSPNSRTAWDNTNVSVSVTVSDSGSGVNTVRRRLSSNDGSTYGTWTTESGSFTVTLSGEGERRIQTEVCDNAGNCRTLTSGVYRIDKTAPSISHSPNSRTAWDNTNVSVTATIADSASGIDTIRRRYSSDNGSTYGGWINSTGDYTVNLTGEGERRIQTEACDNAGNCRTVTSGTYRIDKTAPTISYSPNSRLSWGNTNVAVSATISDSGSGVATVSRRYSSNNGSTWGGWTNSTGDYTVTLSGEGERLIQTEACDNVGNCRTINSGIYRIDKTNPYHNPNFSNIWVRHWNSSTGVEWSPTITTPTCNTSKTICTASVVVCKRTGSAMVYDYDVHIVDDLSGVSSLLTPATLDVDSTVWLDKTGQPSASGSCLHTQDENPCTWMRYHHSRNDFAGNPSGAFLLRLNWDYAADYTHKVCIEK